MLNILEDDSAGNALSGLAAMLLLIGLCVMMHVASGITMRVRLVRVLVTVLVCTLLAALRQSALQAWGERSYAEADGL